MRASSFQSPASSELTADGYRSLFPMQLAKVIGTVVSTQKNRKLEGAKLLLVQPMTPAGEPRGTELLTIDSVGAGVGETVLVVIEGKAAGDALGRKGAAVDAAIIGIVDRIDYSEDI